MASSYGTSRAFPALGAQIETLARFYRRTRPDDADVYVAAAGGAIYTYTMGTEGWVKRSEGHKSDVWSSVTYETTEGGATVDILILSNAKDGMIAVYGSDLRVEKKTLTLGDAYAEVKFATLGGTRNASGEQARKDTPTASSIRGHTTRSTGRVCRKRRNWAAE